MRTVQILASAALCVCVSASCSSGNTGTSDNSATGASGSGGSTGAGDVTTSSSGNGGTADTSTGTGSGGDTGDGAGGVFTGGSAGSTGGNAGSTGGSAGSTGGSAGSTGGSAGSTSGDGGPADDAGCVAPSVTGTAARSSEGVLTNFPAFHFTKTRGNLEISTIYLKLDKLPSFNSIRVWGDLKNTGTTQLCIPLSDTFLLGAQDILIVVDGAAYLGSGTVTYACIEPGGTGFFKGIENDVSATLLDAPTTVSYSVSGLSSTTPKIRHPSNPVLISAAPKQTALGWVLAGRMTAPATIWNFKIGIYPRDASGLLFDDTSAFPMDLGTITAGTQFDFESYSADAKFCSYGRFESFIDGPKTTAFGGASDQNLSGRSLEYASRVEAFDAAKKKLTAATR